MKISIHQISINSKFIGIFIFGLTFPLIEDFYKSGALGSIKIYDVLGISAGMFVFLVIIFAVVTFYFTARIQRSVKPVKY